MTDLGLLEGVVTELAERVAGLVIERLQAGTPGMIDQAASPLGRRRHCAAVRRRVSRGDPGAVLVGRRHLLSPEALAEELRRCNDKAGKNEAVPATTNVRAELDRELSVLRGGRR